MKKSKVLAIFSMATLMFSLASCYERGYGVEQDENKAGYWYNKAAKSGHQDAIKMMQNYKKVMINKFKRIK